MLRSEGDAAKLKLARMEGEKQAETARIEAERRTSERRAAEANLKELTIAYAAFANGGYKISP
jgi:membrane carboxypeptidase/penicillin-binding protein